MSKQRKTMRKRQLGDELRSRRTDAGLLQAEVAAHLHGDRSALSHVECGKTCPSVRTLTLLLDLYGVHDEDARAELFALRESASARTHSEYIPEPYQEYILCEARAHHLRFFELALIPGPLQVPEYVRELARSGLPDASTEEIEDRVSVRIQRQAKLFERSATIEAILSEAAIRCAVGGPGVMAKQLLHLVNMSQRPNVCIRILPASAGAHGSMSCAFVVLDFMREPPVVSIESPFEDLFQDGKREISRYRKLWDSLLAISLDIEESAELMAAAIESYRDGTVNG